MTAEPARLVIRRGGESVDVGSPHREIERAAPVAGTIREDPALAPPHLLVRDAAGGWRIHPDLLWSLLDPLAPRSLDPGADPLAPIRRVWSRLAWWRELPLEERTACAGLFDRCERGGGEIVRILERLAGAGSPFGAASGEVGPAAPARAPVALPLDPAELAEFVRAPHGLGSLYGHRFTPRPQQADLAAAVARALAEAQPLLAEAGTGTGKTLAYLVPLVARLAAGGERAVISTYSRALQTQILDGDLPPLLAGRGDLGARLLMGRANYLCLRQRRAYLTRPLEDANDAVRAAALRLWLLATGEGMRDELIGHPLLDGELRSLFSAVQPCTPECWEQPGCFVVRARRLAREARLVVVNHALLLSDRAAGGALIGPYADLVIDEAHRLPQTVLDAHTVRLDHRRLGDLEELLGAARPAGQLPESPALLATRLGALPDGERAGDAAVEFGRAANQCLHAYQVWWRSAGQSLAPGPAATTGQRLRIADKDVAFAPLSEETSALLETAAAATAASASLEQRAESHGELPPATTDLLVRCVQAGQLLRQLERDVRFVTADPSDRWVTWLDPGPAGVVRGLGATPLEAGPLLRELWQDTRLAPVATSATLAVGEDFAFMLGELGLAGRRPPTATVTVPSPFAWEEQALCLAPEDLPDPDQPGFTDAVVEILIDLRRRAPRQTLVLFTAYRRLQDVADSLRRANEARDLFADPGAELLVQSPHAGAGELRDRFRRSQRAMLLGTSTFWEGVDFPGESLEILVITKLPFLVPNDPWVQARCEHLRRAGDDPFADFMLRDAVLRLRQGLGRLIRRRTDRGVILLLDNRLITRRYGATFLAALPAPLRWLPDRGALAAAAAEFLVRR
ncbi:MAG TPA: ATP-dependent DNA helicase [Candidatus Krumholzibacteria bacterium]|nr:ATP-dependent DNA helicase [Candidatus Krumholzibacteria bacterium]HPD71450.1 ATP-dependent DNA helicase [Candidatus Krumholzibacteria bacterium]HRY41617.1 ATP-dependent DNA helicase [Candidatus Krumholzibacteria bacterium]